MKSLRTLKIISLITGLFLVSGLSIFGQATGKISTRFSNAQFDKQSRTYCLDVELQSNLPGQLIYGMNMRFFYDATKLEFIYMTNFARGYGQVSPEGAKVTHGDVWGTHLFNLESSADAVNEAIQLVNQDSPLEISTQSWTKFFEICFKVPESISDEKDFCPSIIWDLKSEAKKGSFLSGSSGVVITTFKNDVTKKRALNLISALHYNWEGYANQSKIPYGMPLQTNCTPLNKLQPHLSRIRP